MSWQWLTLIAVLSITGYTVARRVLMRSGDTDPIGFSIAFQAAVGMLIATYALALGWDLPDFRRVWLPALLAMVLFAAMQVTISLALRQVGAALFTILFATNALWAMAGWWLISSDRLTWWQTLGAVGVFASVPVALPRQSWGGPERTGIGWALLSGLLCGTAVVAWLAIAQQSTTAGRPGTIATGISWTAVCYLGQSLLTAAAFPRRTRRLVTKAGRAAVRADAPAIGLIAVLQAVESCAVIVAVRRGNALIIMPLLQTPIIITAVIGIVFLKEHRHQARVLTAAAICLASTIALSWSAA